MKVFDLFCGTKSIANVALERDHRVFTLDSNPTFNADDTIDILKKDLIFPFMPDMIWASPPCQGFTVASIGKNWDKDRH